MENRLKYFIYCRKSSEDEDRQILSIDAQLRELNEFARASGLRVVDTLIESKSAHKPGREIFNQMMSRIQQGEADALLVWQINRLSRNAKDGGDIIWAIDEKKIIQIDTPHKQYKNNGDDKFFMTLEFGMAKKYSDDLSDNIRRGNREKYKRGEYSGWAPIGYINTKIDGHPNIALDSETAPIVRKVFEEYATGNYSLGQMVEVIKSWGLTTQKGKTIGKSHLQKILMNQTYKGWYKHGGELHEGNYERLITLSLFEQVQDALHDRSKPKKIRNEWAYAGLIKCGCGCGASIIYETKHKYYKGTDRHAEYTYARSSKRCGVCTEGGIPLSDMEEIIKEKLEQVQIDEESWKLGKELLYAKYKQEAKDRQAIVENREKTHQRLQDELDGYFKMRSREEMTAEEFQQKKNDISAKQAVIQEQINNGLHNQRHWLELANDFFDTAYEAKKMIESDVLEEKRKAVKKVGWNLKLKDGKLDWTYQKPFDVLLIPEYRSEMSRGRDSNPRRVAPIDLQSIAIGHSATSG